MSLCLMMMVASLLETIFITNLLHGSSHYPRAPRWMRVLVLQILGRLVFLHPKHRHKEDTVIQNPATHGRKQEQDDFLKKKNLKHCQSCHNSLPSLPCKKWHSTLQWQRKTRLWPRRGHWVGTRPCRSWGAWARSCRPSALWQSRRRQKAERNGSA